MNEIQFRYQSQIRDTISLQTCKQCMFDDVWNEYYTTWKGTLRFLVTCRKQIVFNCQFLVKIICLNACLSRILNRHVKCKYHNCGFRPWKGRIIIETFSWVLWYSEHCQTSPTLQVCLHLGISWPGDVRHSSHIPAAAFCIQNCLGHFQSRRAAVIR